MKGWVLITGGTRGIGQAVAERFLQEGYSLVLTYRTQHERARELQNKLRMHRTTPEQEVLILSADVCQMESIDSIEVLLREKSIYLQALIFNAGSSYRQPLEEVEWAPWTELFTAHVHWPVFCLQRLLPFLVPGACVLFTGSLMALHPHGTSLAYGISKSAVHALVQNLVKSLAPYEIRVNGVAPGFIATEWHSGKSPEMVERIQGKIALHRFADPREVADTYLYLIRSTYTNGAIIEVSGGYDYQ